MLSVACDFKVSVSLSLITNQYLTSTTLDTIQPDENCPIGNGLRTFLTKQKIHKFT